jgi:uncharacterized membrane protein YdjX (TVP38/TMEM64 family)
MNETKQTTEQAVLAEEERLAAKHKRKVQVITLITLVAFILLATCLSIPMIKDLSSKEGLDALKKRLDSYSGPVGVLVFVAIQALQVIIAIIPPVQIVGGVLFGWFFGGLLSFLGTFLGTLAIFAIVKKFGRPVVEAFVDEKNLTKFKFLQDAQKLTAVLMILYLIPGIPKDVISYLVPLTPISKKDFFTYVMPCRLPAIMMSTVMGSNMKNGNMTVVFVLVGVGFVAAIFGFLYKDVIVNKLKSRKKEK